MPEVGDPFGRYRLVSRLSSGAAGELFLAERPQASAARPVVLEVIHAHLAEDPDRCGRIVGEARLLRRIEHPNVVKIIDVGAHAGRPFIAMEHLRGCSLAELFVSLMQHGLRIHPPVAVAIAILAARGLHAAHQATDFRGRPLGLLHRDLNPHNLLLTTDGGVRITRFAVGAIADEAAVLRASLRWMSPEQSRRHPLDRRTDVYSLSVLLWEMLAGRSRLDPLAPTEALVALSQKPPLDPPSLYRPEVTSSVDRVLLDGLAPNLTARLGSAADLEQRLAAACPEAGNVEPELIAELATWVESAPRRDGRTEALPLLRAPTEAYEVRPMTMESSSDSGTDSGRRTTTGDLLSAERAGDDTSRQLIAWLVIGTLVLLMLVIIVLALPASKESPIEIPSTPTAAP